MAGQVYDFDRVHRLDPDAVGVPGQRHFRIVVQNEQNTAFLWLEKEQLQALGLAVDQLLTPVKAIWTREGEATSAATNRSFVSQLDAGCSLSGFTDNDGATWNLGVGCGVPAGIDHQTVGGGK